MTSPEANSHHNTSAHNVPMSLTNREVFKIESSAQSSFSLQNGFPLDRTVCEHYKAEVLQAVRAVDVLEFLTTAISQSYVTGIKELMKVAEAQGFYADLQFFRCKDRSTTPPVAITFVKEASDGTLSYGLPNITALLDSPEERLRGDNTSSGKKLVRAADGVAESGEDATFGGKVRFEMFEHPVRVLATESSDTELHRPFDLSAQYSEESRVEALNRLQKALTTPEKHSFLADCVIHPELTQVLARHSQLFGARERAEILSVSPISGNGIRIITLDPANKEGAPLSVDVSLTFEPIAKALITH